MVERTEGFSEAEVDAAFTALWEANGPDDLRNLLSTHPVVLTASFHQLLIQVMAEDQATDPTSENAHQFRQLVDYFMYVVLSHEYINNTQALPPAAPSADRKLQYYAPQYFVDIVDQLGDRLPQAEGPTFDPATDEGHLRDELTAICGASTLPAYVTSPGSLWTLSLVACVRCKRRRLYVHAHAVSLPDEPPIKDAVSKRLINAPHCNDCGCQRIYPLRFWIRESPASGDWLGAISCVWKVDDSFVVFQAPPGLLPQPSLYRVIELRSNRLQRELKEWAPLRASRPSKLMRMGATYTSEELSAAVNRDAASDAKALGLPPDTPDSLLAAIQSLLLRLRSRHLTMAGLFAATRQIATAVGAEWTPRINPVISVDDPYPQLLYHLLMEETARTFGHPPNPCVTLSLIVAQLFIQADQPAHAEAALERAKASFRELPPEDESVKRLSNAMRAVKSEYLSKVGKNDELGSLHGQPLTDNRVDSPSSDVGTRYFEQCALNNRAYRALALEEYDEAILLYGECINGWQALRQEVLTMPPGVGVASVPDELAALIEQTLSGDLANVGHSLYALANLAQPTETRLSEESDTAPADGQIAGLLTEPAREYLERTLGRPLTSRRFLEAAARYYREALEISLPKGPEKFVGIQSHALAMILTRLDDRSESRHLLEQAIEYASRAEDEETKARAFCELAKLDITENCDDHALATLEKAALAEMRYSVKLGTAYRELSRTRDLAMVALDLGARSSAPARTVAVVEGVKAIPMAVTLARGWSSQSVDERASSDEDGAELRRQCERLRLALATPGNSADGARSELIQSESDLEELLLSRRAADPAYVTWCDSEHISVGNADDLTAAVARAGHDAVLLGDFVSPDNWWSYLLYDGNARVHRGFGLDSFLITPDDLTEARRVQTQALIAPHAEILRCRSASSLLLFSEHNAFFWPRYLASLVLDDAVLCERMAIAWITAGALEAHVERVSSGRRSCLCVCDPLRSDTAPLRYARQEAEEIERFFRGRGATCDVVAGAEATCGKLAAICGDYDIIHFACHAGPDIGIRDSMRLLLAADPIGVDSGDLTDRRILTDLRLKKGCLVNLVACGSGQRSGTASHLPKGFVDAFLAIGASAVLSTAWPVLDASACIFQSRFYERFMDGGTAAECLAQTQRACIAGRSGATMKAVSEWGGYTVHGLG
jgi:tetratricopeptide (TPR) repeat protein